MTHSEQLFTRAQQHIPGGVNSPVRAFKGVGGAPIFFKKGEGAYLTDEDNKKYIDYVGSWGPMILGHAHPQVIKAVQQACEQGLGFGAPTKIEIEMAELVCQLMPSIESVRMVSSGTEATMTAIRLARGYTQRDLIIKFEGCYHGHADALLVKAGSGALTLGVPSSAGVPADVAKHTVTLEYNNLDEVDAFFNAHGNKIAAVIVEPIAGNMNCVPALPEFLQGLRKLCDQAQAVLIFDEVMTGFRVALGGAQSLYNITPDLTTLGKVIGGGLPVGAIGGRKKIMDVLAPTGPVYQAGTLSGNPIALTAGLTTLQLIQAPNFYENLSQQTKALCEQMQSLAQKAKIPFLAQSVGGMFGWFFSSEKIIARFDQVMQCDVERFKNFYHAMLTQGIYLAPSAYETGFVSACHGEKEIQATLAAAEIAFTKV